jgi:hypothetical protein
MEKFFNTLAPMLQGICQAIDLNEYYNNSEPLKHAVVITAILHDIAHTTDKRRIEHLKVDLKHYVSGYKVEFEKLGINISDYLNFEVK